MDISDLTGQLITATMEIHREALEFGQPLSSERISVWQDALIALEKAMGLYEEQQPPAPQPMGNKALELADALMEADTEYQCPFCEKQGYDRSIHSNNCPFALAYRIIRDAQPSPAHQDVPSWRILDEIQDVKRQLNEIAARLLDEKQAQEAKE